MQDCKLDELLKDSAVDLFLHFQQIREDKHIARPYYDAKGHKYLGVHNKVVAYGCGNCFPYGNSHFCDNHEKIKEMLNNANKV